MGYQVLARKWRPRFFDEMVGQTHVLQALINALNDQRLHHAYLFTGTRGVGKTTIARILAKCLNCEQGVSARPCGECSACTEIAEGRFVDLIEVDAASRTKVEDTRELLDNVQYAPTRGRYKVYLIDEVHMLSTHSFNALLKTLEEPPEHVKFLLATTDPQKLPITVLSRCLQFSLKNMTPENIAGYLDDILKQENVEFDQPSLWSLGRAAQGSMRDALSLTDQAIAYGRGSITEQQVNAMLGTIDRGRVLKLAEVLAKADVNQVLEQVKQMAEFGPDYDEVTQGLMQLWHKLAVAQVAPDAIDNSQGERQEILDLAKIMRPEDIQLFYQTALVGRKDLPLAADPKQGFEMILLRMLAFKPVSVAPGDLQVSGSLLANTGEQATEVAEVKKQQADPVEQSPAVDQPLETIVEQAQPQEAQPQEVQQQEVQQQEAQTQASPVIVNEPVASESVVATSPVNTPSIAERMASQFEDNNTPAQPEPVQAQTDNAFAVPEHITQDVPDFAEHSQLENFAQQSSAPQAQPSIQDAPSLMPQSQAVGGNIAQMLERVESNLVPQVEAAQTAQDEPPEEDFSADLAQLSALTWWQWVKKLPLAGMQKAIALNSAVVSVNGSQVEMDVDPDQSALYNDALRQRIEQALTQATGQPVELLLNIQPPRGETPEQRRQRVMAEHLQHAIASIQSDQTLQNLIQEFNAQLIEGSITPITEVE